MAPLNVCVPVVVKLKLKGVALRELIVLAKLIVRHYFRSLKYWYRAPQGIEGDGHGRAACIRNIRLQ